MTEFHCNRPFLIDDGELAGLDPRDVFVLGYELCQIDRLIESGEAFSKVMRSENIQRVVWVLKRDERAYRISWMSEDGSESWVTLTVEGLACRDR